MKMAKFKKKVKASSEKPIVAPVLNRKQKRKEMRKQKKALKNEFHCKKHGKLSNAAASMDERDSLYNDKPEVVLPKKDPIIKLKQAAEAKRKKLLVEANFEEERNLKKLEKQLNLTKRKGKKQKEETKTSLPKTFKEDGLDYILEVCDSSKLSHLNLEESESEAESDQDSDQEGLSGFTNNSRAHSQSASDESDYDQELSEIEEEEENEDSYDMEGNGEQCEKDSVEDDGTDNEDGDDVGANSDVDDLEAKELSDKDTWEDIYGRKRDVSGNVIQQKYIPPALRGASNDLTRLEKIVKGQLNRLAESNMQGIARLIEDLYAKNSRNDMNECVIKVLKASLALTNALTPERLAMEHAVLVAILHANVGSEVGATITQKWVESLMELYERNEVDSKETDNHLMFLSYLYAFRVVSHELVFDILFKFLTNYSVKDIELIILALKTVGFNLRKDDSGRLKDLIVQVQRKSTENDSSDSRVKFMLETLMAIRNNNVKKMPNYDPTHQVHLSKIVRSFLRPGAEITPLSVKLDDLLNADSRGRWWIVGSAWSGREEANEKASVKSVEPNFSSELLEAARKMRMNTDNRRNIFCTIMSSNDFMDAFEKIIKLGMKSPVKEKESAFVLTICCVSEPKFNLFYPHVASKLARHDRKFRMAVQCAIWDRLSALVSGKAEKSFATNLALFTSILIREGALPMTCLKKVEFADMNKNLTLYLRTLIKDMLMQVENEQERNAPFHVIAGKKEHHMLRESLRLFMHHFLLKSKKESDPVLKSRVESAENALSK